MVDLANLNLISSKVNQLKVKAIEQVSVGTSPETVKTDPKTDNSGKKSDTQKTGPNSSGNTVGGAVTTNIGDDTIPIADPRAAANMATANTNTNIATNPIINPDGYSKQQAKNNVNLAQVSVFEDSKAKKENNDEGNDYQTVASEELGKTIEKLDLELFKEKSNIEQTA